MGAHYRIAGAFLLFGTIRVPLPAQQSVGPLRRICCQSRRIEQQPVMFGDNGGTDAAGAAIAVTGNGSNDCSIVKREAAGAVGYRNRMSSPDSELR